MADASSRPDQTFPVERGLPPKADVQDVPLDSIINHDELTDLRAYQRTFDGAYTRTALGQLSYAILILRLFERDFYWCGMIYTALAVQLTLISIYRYNLAVSNESRWKEIKMSDLDDEARSNEPQATAKTASSVGAPGSVAATSSATAQYVQHQPTFRQTFRTAGTVVALATAGTLLLEIALAVLVIRM